MPRVNSSEENVTEKQTEKSVKEPQAANCPEFNSSLSQVSPVHTNEASTGKISLAAISSFSKLIAGDITSYINITEDRINLTFSFPKSNFGQMSRDVLQELDKPDSNNVENVQRELSKNLKFALTNGSDTQKEDNTLSGKTLNRSFLSDIAYRSDMNNTSDILSSFMKDSYVSNPETDCREVSTSLNSDDQEKKLNSKMDKSLENSRQESLKIPSEDASDRSIGTTNDALENKTSSINSQEDTSEVCFRDAQNIHSDYSNVDVSVVSVQMTPKFRKSLELKVDPTRSLSIEFGCSTNELGKDGGNMPKCNNLKDKMVCHVPEYSNLNSKSGSEVIEDNTGCDLTVCITKNSPESEKANTINTNPATNLELAGVPMSKEMSESGEIDLEKGSFDTSLKTSAQQDYSQRSNENGSFDGDKQLEEQISTKSDVWPEIHSFTKIDTIPAKEIESCVLTDVVIKYFRFELLGRCMVVKTVIGGKEISVEIGEYKKSDSCDRESFKATSKLQGSLDMSNKTQMSDNEEIKMEYTVKHSERVNRDEISTLLQEATGLDDEREETKITSKSQSSNEFGLNVDSEENCSTLEKSELSNKCVSRRTSSVIQCDTTEYMKTDNSNDLGKSKERHGVSQHIRPTYNICESEQKNKSEASCKEDSFPSISDTPTETSALRTLSDTPVSSISGHRSNREITNRVQGTRPLEDTLLSTSDKYQRVSHTSTPSGTPKRLSLMFKADIANDESKMESLPRETREDQTQDPLSFKTQSVTELPSREVTGTISSEVSCSSITENEPFRDKLISSSKLLTPNSTQIDSTLPASVVDDVTASSFINSMDDSGNVTPTYEEGVSIAVIESKTRSSTAVDDEANSTFTAVEDEEASPSSPAAFGDEEASPSSPAAVGDEEASPSSPAAVEDETDPSTSEAVDDEAAPTYEEIQDETLSPPEAAKDDSQTSVEIADAKSSPEVDNEASVSSPRNAKSGAECILIVENGVASLSSTDGAVSSEPSPEHSGSRDPTKLVNGVVLIAEAEVNPESSSPKSSKYRTAIDTSSDSDGEDTEADGLRKQTKNASSVEDQSEEEISTDPTAESNEETAAENSSVTSTVEDADTVDSASSDATESSSSKLDDATRHGVSNGVHSEDESNRGDETSNGKGGKPKTKSYSGADRQREKIGRTSSADISKSKASRTKRVPRDSKPSSSSVDEVDLAPTRARYRNPPSSLTKDAIPENSAVTGKYEKHASRTSSSVPKPRSPSKRNLRSKSLDPSPTKTPTKSSSRKSESVKPAPLENEAVARVKRSESISDRDPKTRVRSSPRKAKPSVAPLDAAKSSGEGALDSQPKLRSTSNVSLLNTRRSKRGTKD